MTCESTQRTWPMLAWHWILAAAALVGSGWLYVEGEPAWLAGPLTVFLAVWSSWAIHAGVQFRQHRRASLTQFRQVHTVMRWFSRFAGVACLLLALYCGLILLFDPPSGWDSLGYLIGTVLLPLIAVPCGIVSLISRAVIRSVERQLDQPVSAGSPTDSEVLEPTQFV
jgi:peptidoglycan/LPS O-acetylase OafA/YrhL